MGGGTYLAPLAPDRCSEHLRERTMRRRDSTKLALAGTTVLSRIAVGACAALLIGTAALAQTSQPAPAPAAPAAPAASPYPPTATITTTGYPGIGPPIPSSASSRRPPARRSICCRRRWRRRSGAGSTMRSRRCCAIDSGDTVVLETMMHSHNQVVPGRTIEEIKKLRTDFPGRGPHTVTGPIYVEEARAGRRAQGDAQQDRAARLRDQFQRAGHVRRVPEGVSRTAR